MKLIIIFGPQAVGKMTVGQELEKITGLKLFHNHMTIDLVSNFFSYGTKSGKRLVNLFREEIFKEVASSDLGGLIFTYVWALDEKSDWDYIEKVANIFKKQNGTIYYVELEAELDERIKRNTTENRLAHKPTKRDLQSSEKRFNEDQLKHRLNSQSGEINFRNYIRINNTYLDAASVAKKIKDDFGL